MPLVRKMAVVSVVVTAHLNAKRDKAVKTWEMLAFVFREVPRLVEMANASHLEMKIARHAPKTALVLQDKAAKMVFAKLAAILAEMVLVNEIKVKTVAHVQKIANAVRDEHAPIIAVFSLVEMALVSETRAKTVAPVRRIANAAKAALAKIIAVLYPMDKQKMQAMPKIRRSKKKVVAALPLNPFPLPPSSLPFL